MRTAGTSRLMGLLTLAIIAGPLASAQDAGLYLGGNLGQSRANIDERRITSSLLGSGFSTESFGDHDRDTAYKLFAGYQFSKYFALEGGYFNLGKFDFRAYTAPAGSLSGQIKLNGFNLDAVFLVPFTEKFSGFARLGAASARAEDSFISTGLVHVLTPASSKRAIHPKVGLGIQYQFTPAFGLRLEGERYRINDAVGNRGDVDLVSAGLVLRFGRKRPVATPIQEPMAIVNPAPVVEGIPVPAPVPAPVPTQVYCTILDIQFEIDEGEIQNEDREKLAVVGVFLAKYPETTAVIEGHADGVGAEAHNQRLSQQRAESVVTYLIQTYGIAPSRLKAVGYGSSRPIADNASEQGKRQNRRIGAVIACATDIEGLKVVPARITVAMLIEFDAKQAAVKPEYNEELAKLAKFMKANPQISATVEGHTGNLQASPNQAMEISQERAQNVVNHLVDKCGIERSRLTAEGFGKSRKFAYSTTVEGQQDNRRVNIIFTYSK